MKLAIVGSRSITDFQILDCFGVGALRMYGIELFDVTHIVSGGAIGVDKLAERLIKKYKSLKITPVIHKPDYQKYGRRQAPLERNTLIAEDCDAAVILWDSESGGTWNTLRKIDNLDKPFILIHILVEEPTARKPKKQTVRDINFRGDWKKLYEEKVHPQRNSGKPAASH